MDVVIGPPVVVRAPHVVRTDELVQDMERRYGAQRPSVGWRVWRALRRKKPPGRSKLPVWVRMLRATGVVERPWAASVEETAGRAGVGVRSRAAYEAARDMAVSAAEEALRAGGLSGEDVDVLVTTHTTSWTIPGLDVDLVGLLNLRPDVIRVGLATEACAGGAHGLGLATRLLRGGRPGGRALVVAAESLSTLYHPDSRPPRMQDVLYGGLFGDAAGAVVLTAASEARAGDLVVEDVWELVLPDSAESYWGDIAEAGVAFDSGAEAVRAPGRVVPYLLAWLDGRPVRWAAVHPGGPGIISGTLSGLSLDPETAGEYSFASLAGGNLGGVALMDVLARTMADDGARGPGLAVAFGPGFTAAGLHLREARPGAAS